MIDCTGFRNWLTTQTTYSHEVIGDVVSRAKRADSILEWYADDLYLFHLGNNEDFLELSTSVKSQIKKAVKLYKQYQCESKN